MLDIAEMRIWAGNTPVLSKLTREAVFGETPSLFDFRTVAGKMLNTYKEVGWVEYGMGRHRAVWGPENGAFVVKVSYTMAGAQANLYEWLTARGQEVVHHAKWDIDIPVPLVLNYKLLPHNVSLLFVEKVTRVVEFSFDEKAGHEVHNPEWAEIEADWMELIDMDYEGPQVGKTVDGRVVCFDWCPF